MPFTVQLPTLAEKTEAVKKTHEAVMARVDRASPAVQFRIAALKKSTGPIALGPILKVIDDAILIRFYGRLRYDIGKVDTQAVPPKFKGSPSQKADSIRNWMAENETVLDQIALIHLDRAVRKRLAFVYPDQGYENSHFRGTLVECAEAIHNLMEGNQAILAQSVSRLNLHDLNLIKIPPMLGLFTELQFLDLSGNHLKSLEGMPQLLNLDTLYLNNNDLSSLEGMPLLDSLKLLNVNDNRLATLSGTPAHPNLTGLLLDGNFLVHLRDIPQFPSLQFLHARNNQLTTLEGMTQLASLQSLMLSHNKLTDLQGIPQCDNLSVLHLHHNQLANTQGISQFQELTELSLHHNRLTNIHETSELLSLQSVDVSHNQLTVDGLPDVQEHGHLQTFNLGHNRLTHLPYQIFDRIYRNRQERLEDLSSKRLRGHTILTLWINCNGNPMDGFQRFRDSFSTTDFLEVFDPRTLPCSMKAELVVRKALAKYRGELFVAASGAVGALLGTLFRSP